MKSKILGILVCMLVAIWSSFTVVASIDVDNLKLVTKSSNIKQEGNTLITDFYTNQVIEVDYNGTIVWLKDGLNQPSDAERLQNGNTLTTEMYGNRVIELDKSGNVVWEYEGVLGPWDVERLANGNTLIVDSYASRVIEVDSTGTVVWEKDGLNLPVDAERLDNQNTLIAETQADRVIEVDYDGNIIWELPVRFPVDVEILANGCLLITLYFYENRVIEVCGGEIVWEYKSSGFAFDAERLANGNTLITEAYYGNRVVEVDSSGTIVWQKADLFFPVDAERLSTPPEAPSIDGQTSGKPGKEYEYTFNAADPDGDDVKYHIDWGDNNTEWTDYYSSGTDVGVKHSWDEEGNYTIKAKAVDINGIESAWGTFEVNIPRNKPVNFKFSLVDWFFKRSTNAFLVIRYLLRFN